MTKAVDTLAPVGIVAAAVWGLLAAGAHPVAVAVLVVAVPGVLAGVVLVAVWRRVRTRELLAADTLPQQKERHVQHQ